MTTTTKRNTPTNIIRSIPLESIRPDPGQPRKTFDLASLWELAFSIRENGLLQPISVRVDPENADGFLIIAGERRYRAHALLEAPTVKAIVFNADDEKATRLQLIENLNRQDLNAAEEYYAYGKLADAGVSIAEIARITSKGIAHVTVFVQIARNGSPMLMDMLQRAAVNRWTAWQIRELPHHAQDTVLRAMANDKLSKQQVAGMVEGLKAQLNQSTMFEPEPQPEPARKEAQARTRKTFDDMMSNIITLATKLEREYENDPIGFAGAFGVNINEVKAQAKAAHQQLGIITRRIDQSAGTLLAQQA